MGFTSEEGVPSGGQRIYKALISQTGTDAPTVSILENTLGPIVWSYSAVGDYLGTLTGAFVNASKVAPSLGLNQLGEFDYSIGVANDNNIQIETTDGGFSSDDVLGNALVIIEVYP